MQIICTVMKKEDFKNFDLKPLNNYQSGKIVMSIILDIRRTKANGKYPCKIRLTYLKQQGYYFCMDLSVSDYSRLHGTIKDAELLKNKKLIAAKFEQIKDIANDIELRYGFSFDMLNRRLKRGTEDSIINAFNYRIDELENEGSIGTAQWYGCAKNSIEKFGGTDLKFASITVDWLKKYQAQMIKEKKKYTTISINMRALRAIMNGGVQDGIISQAQYPFRRHKHEKDKYQIPTGTGREIALTEDEILSVFEHEIPPEQEKWRDLFVFSYYCNGINVGDMLRLKYKDIVGNNIEWSRKKTETTNTKKDKIQAFIKPDMMEIINLYGNADKSPDNFIFPYLKPGLTPIEERKIVQEVIHKINKVMKKIGKELGFNVPITSYVARHTFAAVNREKGTKLYNISKYMGHKNLKTTENYLGRLKPNELAEDAENMQSRRKNHLSQNKTA